MIMLFISIRSEGNIPVMKVVNFRKTGENENIEYHGKYIRVDISYSLLGQNPLITFLIKDFYIKVSIRKSYLDGRDDEGEEVHSR